MICTECGFEFQTNLSYCPNCKCNIKTESKKTTEVSPNRIKLRYYFGIASIIGSFVLIISGLHYGDHITWIFGGIVLVLTIIQFPKQKKEFDSLSKNPRVT
jgi:hypothetical protein